MNFSQQNFLTFISSPNFTSTNLLMTSFIFLSLSWCFFVNKNVFSQILHICLVFSKTFKILANFKQSILEQIFAKKITGHKNIFAKIQISLEGYFESGTLHVEMCCHECEILSKLIWMHLLTNAAISQFDMLRSWQYRRSLN